MAKVADRAQETTTVTGTGTATLLGATTDYHAFSVPFSGTSTPVCYLIDDGAGNWEVGLGTYTLSGTTLSRTTVLSSSNSGSLVSFAAGTKTVSCVFAAQLYQSRGKQTLTDSSGNLTITIDVSLADAFYVVMATHANTLTLAFSGMVDGQTVYGRIKQDSTGGRLIAFTNVKWQNGVAPVASTGANVLDFVVLTYDATDATWIGNYSRAYS